MGIRGTKTWDDVQSWLAAAGTVTAGSYNASAAWSFGAPSGTQTHTFAGNFVTVTSTPASNSGIRLNNTNAAGAPGLTLQNSAADKWTLFNDNSNNKFTISDATLTVGGITQGGAWILGPATGTAKSHLIQSGAITTLTVSSPNTSGNDCNFIVDSATAGSAASQIQLAFGGSIRWTMSAGGSYTAGGTVTAGDMAFRHSTAGTVGSIAADGHWTFGATTGTSLEHLFQTGTGSSTIKIKSTTIGQNAQIAFLGNNTGPTSVQWNVGINITNQTSAQLEFYNAATATLYGTVTGATGAWVLGNATAANHTVTDHAFYGRTASLFNNNGAGASAQFAVETNGTSAKSAILRLKNSAGASTDVMQFCHGAGLTTWSNGAGTTLGSIDLVTNLGSWTLGGAATASLHRIQNTSTSTGIPTLRVANNDTSTSSDNVYAIEVLKGSTTNGAGTNRFIFFSTGAGNSGYIGSNTANQAAFFSTSDRRAKKDITGISDALDKVMDMNPVTFKWKADDSSGVGFIAQEIAEILPQVVSATDDGEGEDLEEGQTPWSMTESGFVPYLVKALQELKQQFDDYVLAHP